MFNRKKTVLVTVSVLLLGILGLSVFIILKNTPNEEPREVKEMHLVPDQGLNIQFIDETIGPEGLVGERAIFERYRFHDAETNEEIDIREENIRAFVDAPNEEEREITTGNIFYAMRLYPVPLGGEYKFRIEMPDNIEYRGKIEFPEPQATELIFNDQITRDEELLQELAMDGVDLRDADSVFHIPRDNTLQYLSFTEGESVIIGTGVINEEGYILLNSETVNSNHHIFLAKHGDLWHYTELVNPE